jgi:hypothetical protein
MCKSFDSERMLFNEPEPRDTLAPAPIIELARQKAIEQGYTGADYARVLDILEEEWKIEHY